jgi:hypothetical protein
VATFCLVHGAWHDATCSGGASGRSTQPSPGCIALSGETSLWAARDGCVRWVARTVLGVEPIELAGGHFPMVERPRELADVLERLLEQSA